MDGKELIIKLKTGPDTDFVEIRKKGPFIVEELVREYRETL